MSLLNNTVLAGVNPLKTDREADGRSRKPTPMGEAEISSLQLEGYLALSITKRPVWATSAKNNRAKIKGGQQPRFRHNPGRQRDFYRQVTDAVVARTKIRQNRRKELKTSGFRQDLWIASGETSQQHAAHDHWHFSAQARANNNKQQEENGMHTSR